MHFTGLRKSAATAVVAAWTLLELSAVGAAQTPEPQPPAGAPGEMTVPEAAEPTAPAEETAEEGAPAEATAAEAEVTAEAEAPPPEQARGQRDDEIVITGTRIKRTQSFGLPSSVAVADRKQLAQTGANNLSDVIRTMSINYGSDLNLGLGTNAGGTAQFNLRGLGLNSTLVLLNGKRVVDSGALSIDGTNFVDTNTLPMQAIERMEILKGGASAIYGSDAVAGVVNIITRKHMNGFEGQVGYQTTGDGDQHEWDASLVGGAQGPTTRVMAMASYFKREPLGADQRSFTDQPFPGYFSDVSASSYPSLFIQVDPDHKPLLTDPSMAPGPMNPSRTFVDPGCQTAAGPSTFIDPTTKTCRFDFNKYFMLVPNEQRANLYATLEQDIGEHAMAYFEAGYARNRTFRTESPALQLNAPIYIPADNQWNPTGNILQWVGRMRGGAYPPWLQYFESDTLHTAAGVKGDFGGLAPSTKLGQWQWELAGTWSATRFNTHSPDTMNTRLQAAVNSCNPSAMGYDPSKCWNPFSFGPRNSQQLFDTITNETWAITDNELTTAALDFNGPLFALPGGDASIAIGGQVRRQTTAFDADHLSNIGDNEFSGARTIPDFRASRTIGAGYGELGLPFARALEVQVAGRLERYSDVGSSGFNPMLGLTWTPATTFLGDAASDASKVRVRGTYARSFVAPSLLQAHGILTAPTPLQNARAGANGELVRDAPNYVVVRAEGNPYLKPQTSIAFTGGLEWNPIKGLGVQADYWHYDFQDIIIAESAQQIIDRDYQNQSDPNILRAGSVVQQVAVKFQNAKSVTTHGLDIDLNYRTNLDGAGGLSVGANTSYVFSYDIPRSDLGARASSPDAKCNADTCNVAGLRNGSNFARAIPRLRVTIPVTWSLKPHSASIIGHFISSYKDEQYVPAGTPPAAAPYYPIDSYFSLDLQYAFRIAEGEKSSTTLKIGVNNVFDAAPPPVHTNLGYDTETHDPRGRLLYARLIQEL